MVLAIGLDKLSLPGEKRAETPCGHRELAVLSGPPSPKGRGPLITGLVAVGTLAGGHHIQAN